MLQQKIWGDLTSLPDEQVCLGFDCGFSAMGVAVGQSITQSATPLQALTMKRYTPCWDAVTQLIERWQPHLCVVGWPLKLDGQKQTITKHAEHFAHTLHTMHNMVVVMVDERYSSVAAREVLFEAEGQRGLAKEKVDSYVAKLLIEQWFSTRNLH